MPRKKANGEGSIYKRKDGRWCGQIATGRDNKGKLKLKYVYGRTKKEAHEKMVKLQTEINMGAYIEPSKTTLEDWIYKWLFLYKKNSIRPKTFSGYEYVYRVHIKGSKIGKTTLKDLKPYALQQHYNEKFQTGLSERTVKLIHTIIHGSLEKAVDDELIVKNVSKMTELPKDPKKKISDKKIKILESEDQKKLLNLILNDEDGIGYFVMYTMGLRPGETISLHWNNIDFENNILTVEQDLQRIKVFNTDGEGKSQLVFGETKNGKIRHIEMPEVTAELLKLHQVRQKIKETFLHDIYEDQGLVFPTYKGTPMEPSNFDRKFKQLLKKANIDKINLHALRHTFAAVSLANNTDVKTLQDILGHSSAKITLDIYGHVLEQSKKKSASNMNSHIEKILTNKE